MPDKVPKKLFFQTDLTVAEFVNTGKDKKGNDILYYRYIQAFKNIGQVFPMSLDQINYLKSINFLRTE